MTKLFSKKQFPLAWNISSILGLVNYWTKMKCESLDTKSGLLVIDAQKFFIPGHPEWDYNYLNNTSHMTHFTKTHTTLIPKMVEVVNWAHQNNLPIITTYEAYDTGQDNYPSELLEALGPNVGKYIKWFYDATKHPKFVRMIEDTQIKHWYVIGAELDVCVYQTVFGLVEKGYQVTIIMDATYSGCINEDVEFENLSKLGEEFINQKAIFSSLGVNFVSFDEIPETLFPPSEPPQLPKIPKFEDTVFTLITPDTTVPFTDNGNKVRYDHLRQFITVTSAASEEYAINTQIPPVPVGKTRVFAGAVTQSVISQYPNSIVLLDTMSVPNTLIENTYYKQELKILIYIQMEEVDLYFKPVGALNADWKRAFANACVHSTEMPYLEDTQNASYFIMPPRPQ